MKRLIKLATVSSLLVCMSVPVMAADVSTEEPTQHLATVTMVADETGEMTVDSVNGVEPTGGINNLKVSGTLNTSTYTTIGSTFSPNLLWDTLFVSGDAMNPGYATVQLKDVNNLSGSAVAGPVLVGAGQNNVKIGKVDSNGSYKLQAQADTKPGTYTFYVDSNIL